jgi:hypothetical protein
VATGLTWAGPDDNEECDEAHEEDNDDDDDEAEEEGDKNGEDDDGIEVLVSYDPSMRMFGGLLKLFDESSYILSWDSVNLSGGNQTVPSLHHQLESQLMGMQFHLEHLLLQAKNNGDDNDTIEHAKAQLRDITHKVVQLTIQLPYVEDFQRQVYEIVPLWLTTWCEPMTPDDVFPELVRRPTQSHTCLALENHAAVLHCTAQLFLNLLQTDVDYNPTSKWRVHVSAIALCLMTTVYRDICSQNCLLIKRSLVWAGLVLTQSVYPEGNS